MVLLLQQQCIFGYECEVSWELLTKDKNLMYKVHLLGAKIHSVTSGKGTLKDAMNDALRYWVSLNTYIIGTVAGPHPYPKMVEIFNL